MTVTVAVDLDCDPCIDRSAFLIRAILPTTTSRTILDTLRQTGRDMNVAIDIVQADADGNGMVQAIRVTDPNTVNALVVTAPNEAVAAAVEMYMLENPTVPVFGWGWGYEQLAAQSLGWITDHADEGGRMTAQELHARVQEQSNATLNSVALLHSRPLSEASTTRWDAFLEEQTTLGVVGGRYNVLSFPANNPEDSGMEQLTNVFRNCPYQAVVVADPFVLDDIIRVRAAENCDDRTLLAVFLDDTDAFSNPMVYQAITRQQVAFCLNGQVHLQVTLAALMAAVYVTTGKVVAMPIESSTYWSGPLLINARNVPSDTAASCEQSAFPVCSFFDQSSSSFQTGLETTTEDGTSGSVSTTCPCTERREIRIGGVLHGDTTDAFWDPVFAAARQAATDMHIQLDLVRYQPQVSMSLIYEQMAARIRNLCDSGVDGLFVTIPDDTVLAAVQRCHELRVPVVSVNSGQTASQALGLPHHIGQDEYSGGYGGAERLIAAGMKRGYCVDHAFGNTALQERCQGFRDAIAAHGGDVTFGSHISVPSDNQEQYVINVTEAVEADGGWEGVGLLGFGADPIPSLLRVLGEHPNVVAGTFDTSDVLFEAIRNGKVLFGIDQQPFLQGKMPVYLLAYMVYTQQALTNHVIQSGPSFVEEFPSDAQQICEANFFAVCPDRPEEDMTYIPNSLLALGYALFGMLALACLIAVTWTYKYREKWVVRISQPMKDRDDSGEFLDSDNPDIGKVDAGCMAVPWFYGLGFVITFSALFAKIHRVRLIYRAGLQMQRKQTKDINSDFAESSFVSLAVVFMFQVLVLTVPISALVRDNTDVLYFVQATAVFLQNFTVLFLIFVPKMLRMSEDQRNPASRPSRTTSLRRQPRQSGSAHLNGRGTSWAGASLTDREDGTTSRQLRYSEDELSAIWEEGSRRSFDNIAERAPVKSVESGSSSERAPVVSGASGSSVRRSVRFSAVEKSDDVSVSSEFEAVANNQRHQLSPDEVESEWEELGFPSKDKAQMIFDLLQRSTDAERRKTILKGLLDESPTEYSTVPTVDPESLSPEGTGGKVAQPVDRGEQSQEAEPPEEVPPETLAATTNGGALSSKPTNVSPRAFSDHLKSGLSELGEDSFFL
eukprot:scaffold6120_cov162-Amphora_coffeaeformis.AAC.6